MYLLVFLRESLTFFLSLPPSENAKKNRRISSVAMILELKMHARNMRAHAYTRARIFRRVSIETRKMCARECSQNSLLFLVFLGVFFERRDKCSLQKSADARIR